MILATNWIWTPDWTEHDKSQARIVYFRKAFEIADDAMKAPCRIRISADSRYKLYVNGIFVQDGPQKALDLKEWNGTMGVPSATNKGTGALTMESLLYAYGLKKAADMSDFIGRTGVAEEYRTRARSVLEAVKRHAMGTYTDAEGHSTVLLEDGPGVADFSVHPQVFAVLTGLVTPEEGRKMLEATVGNPDMAQSSVSYMFYLFRALEMTGWYEKTDELWNLWRKMVREHMSTCVENGTDSRSDCHAWSALMLYELPCAVLGVTPAAPGFRKMNIHPHAGALKSAKGDVITPVGNVHVEWSLDSDGEMKLSYQAPDEVEVLSPES